MITHKSKQDSLMQLYHSCSLDQLIINFKNITENYFVETFALAILLKKEKTYANQGKLFSTFDSYPPEWITYYNKKKYYLSDPVFLCAQNITTPYYWNADKFNDINDLQKRILSEACDFGIKRGTTIPLLPNGKFNGTLTLVDSNIYHPEAMYTLANASQIYLNRREYFELRNKLHALTDKEMKVLALKAEGYSVKQISFELSISDSTVIFHLKNIRNKLELTTTEQAVLKYITANIYD